MKPELRSSTPFHPVERALIELCRRAHVSDARSAGLLEAMRDPGGPRELLALAQHHRVMGLVLSRVQQELREDPDTPEWSSPLLASLPLLERQSAIWEMELARIVGRLATLGLEPMVLKGGVLRHTFYDRPIERLIGDIDLLVARSDIEPLIEALGELGYRSPYEEEARAGFERHHYHQPMTHAGGFGLEVHWGLTRPDELHQLDPESFLVRGRRAETEEGLSLVVPSPEDLLLHTVSQSERDGLQRLRRIVDLDRIISRGPLDWEYVTTSADAWGLRTLLSVTCRLSVTTMKTSIPEELTDPSRVGPLARGAISAMRPLERLVRETSRAPATSSSLFRMWCLPTWRSRVTFLRRHLAGDDDPLQWVWDKHHLDEPTRPTVGAISVAKLVILQLFVIAGGLGRVLARSAATRSFWRRDSG